MDTGQGYEIGKDLGQAPLLPPYKFPQSVGSKVVILKQSATLAIVAQKPKVYPSHQCSCSRVKTSFREK